VRRRSVVATVALTAALALAALPAPAGSQPASSARVVDPAAFRQLAISAIEARELTAPGALDATLRSDGHLAPTAVFTEPGTGPTAPLDRADVSQPAAPLGTSWKPPRYTISGYATFYDHGTTAMRLPRGTVVRICGAGGCIERTITDYGPHNVKGRIADLYRPDFFEICGCAWFAGSTWVSVSVY